MVAGGKGACYASGDVKPAAAKKFVFSRRGPEIPNDLAHADTTAFPDGGDFRLAERSLREARIEFRGPGTLRVETAVLERVALADTTIGSVAMKDVRLIGCDLPQVQFEGCRDEQSPAAGRGPARHR
ncbi:MAG: hypothetical protein M3N93_15525 [Acidobacteriota bacterium]|nr:hypothetical protein [Acidobacteriota bacterium]